MVKRLRNVVGWFGASVTSMALALGVMTATPQPGAGTVGVIPIMLPIPLPFPLPAHPICGVMILPCQRPGTDCDPHGGRCFSPTFENNNGCGCVWIVADEVADVDSVTTDPFGN